MSIQIVTKRVYEPYSKSDGYRILVDRLWPRGISKEKSHVDIWFKEISPSTELRKWFNHEQEKYGEFKSRYRLELDGKKELIELFFKELKTKKVTLVFASRELKINHAVVLMDYMNTIIKRLKL